MLSEHLQTMNIKSEQVRFKMNSKAHVMEKKYDEPRFVEPLVATLLNPIIFLFQAR